MSQPNGDPPSHSPKPPDDTLASQDAAPDPPVVPTSAGPSPLPPTPRVNPPTVFNQKDAVPAPTAPEPGFNDFLAWMQARASEQPTAPPAAAPGQRALLPKEQKKFHRVEADLRTDKKASAEDGTAGSTGSDDAPDAATSVVRKRRKTNTAERPAERQWPWFPALILLALLFGSFKLGRATAPARAPAATGPVAKAQSKPTGEQAAQVADLIDQAMNAESRGDFKAATGFLERAQALDGHVAGLEYHLAQLAFERTDLPRAMTLLDHCIETANESAASYNLRGTIVNRMTGVSHGLENLEEATRLDPFNARYFFFLGEALRRAGRPQLALVRLHEAMDRLRDPTLEGIYESKIRLTQIELGQEADFTGQLAEELQQTPPSTDSLLTAAALEMHRGHFDVAAGYLDKASSITDQQTMTARLSDYYFLPFTREKPLTRFFAANTHLEATPIPAVGPAFDPLPILNPPPQPSAFPSPLPSASNKP